ncbi:hypothetical protein HanXRQr2_Chr02g0062231 [Helianthus annuus]|uniref:Uncharacterized protein n=1 Tax=Helianthus annuus TaxID=4232 RepID=A0A9K3JME2_HELAN|nr:hypothetical protein HanXRQr2_Chr02g0062231 [Helianthus annuus]
MPGICQEYARNMPGICQEYTRNIPGICQEYARNMLYGRSINTTIPSLHLPHHHTSTISLSLSRKATAKHPLSIHQFFGFDHHIPSPYKYQGSRIRRLGANGKRRTSFSCFYPPYLRLDSSLASS